MNHPHALLRDSPAVGLGVVLFLLAAGVVVLANRRRRWRAAGLALAALIALFGLETAVHSVHHLADPAAAASCVLSSGSERAPAACPAPPDTGAPRWTAESSAAAPAVRVRPLPAFRAHEGRAPPVSPSA